MNKIELNIMLRRHLRHLPNAITLFRGVGGFLIAWALIQGAFHVASALFLLCAMADLADGWLARRFGWTSVTGSLLDPICDKLFFLSLFSLFMVEKLCPPWFLGLQVSTVLLQCVGLLLQRLQTTQGASPFVPLRSGVWCTAGHYGLLSVIILTYFYPTIRNSLWLNGLFLGLAVFQIVVFLQYFLRTQPTLVKMLRLNLLPRLVSPSA